MTEEGRVREREVKDWVRGRVEVVKMYEGDGKREGCFLFVRIRLLQHQKCFYLSATSKEGKGENKEQTPLNVLHTTWCGKHTMLRLQKPCFS